MGPALRYRRASRYAPSAVRLSAVRTVGQTRVLLRAIFVTVNKPVRSDAGVPVPGRCPVEGRAANEVKTIIAEILQYCELTTRCATDRTARFDRHVAWYTDHRRRQRNCRQFAERQAGLR